FFQKEVARAAVFVGFGNFVKLYNDPIFWQAVRNTIIFTGVATIFKASGGLGMALVMNQSFKMKAFTRAALLLPFIVPTVLSTVAWQRSEERRVGKEGRAGWATAEYRGRRVSVR